MIVVDGIKFKQVLYNLVSNAVKFSPDHSKVQIVARRLAASESPINTQSIAVSVIDHGIGIAPEDQHAIFDEFRQIHPPGTRRPQGTGLGLSVVKRFTELHGGVVEVESDEGRGSTFRVVIPDRAMAAPG
jgi:signal transduction histidine kinase